MSPSPILSIIHAVTIDRMLNFDGDNDGHGSNTSCVNKSYELKNSLYQ